MKNRLDKDKNNGRNGGGKVDRVEGIGDIRKDTSPTINIRKL